MIMTTPIVDFLKRYSSSSPLRLHMPGHKGKRFLCGEEFDITETEGADELYSPTGIIAESEKNASYIFGCDTYYSAEGSSLCIRAMIYLLGLKRGKKPVILAGRNAHKSFLYGAALTGADVLWLAPHKNDTYMSVTTTAEDVEKALSNSKKKIDAVYITTPDYLGKTTDIKSISAVCKKHGVYLLADCAHGAYTHFLQTPSLSTDLGADMCCSSAHKTLPALTGAAYLHINTDITADEVKAALLLFGSTSPSYLILASLDNLNPYLTEHKKRLSEFLPEIDGLKKKLVSKGYELYGGEPLKLTIRAKEYGYTGFEIYDRLTENGVYPEYRDDSYVSMMITPENGVDGLDRLYRVLSAVPQKAALPDDQPIFVLPKRRMSVREAFFAEKETLPTGECGGRILSDMRVSCPPAVCPVVCGEVIDGKLIPYLIKLGFNRLSVVKNP